MGSMKCLIQNNIDNESDYMNDIFICISDEILGYCYGNELEKVQELSTSLAPSDFLKQDTNFYKHIIQRLKTRYLNNKSFKTAFDTIFVK